MPTLFSSSQNVSSKYYACKIFERESRKIYTLKKEKKTIAQPIQKLSTLSRNPLCDATEIVIEIRQFILVEWYRIPSSKVIGCIVSPLSDDVIIKNGHFRLKQKRNGRK